MQFCIVSKLQSTYCDVLLSKVLSIKCSTKMLQQSAKKKKSLSTKKNCSMETKAIYYVCLYIALALLLNVWRSKF